MRSSSLISVVLLSALVAPLPFEFIFNSYQRRGLGPWFKGRFTKTRDKKAASVPSSSSDSRDLETPLLPDSRGTLPGDLAIRPPPEINPSYLIWQINHFFEKIIASEHVERQTRARNGQAQGGKVTWSEFLDKVSGQNQRIWEKDNVVLAARLKEFQADHQKDTAKLEDESKARRGRESDGESAIDAEALYAARQNEWNEFIMEREAHLAKIKARYRAVDEWVEEERGRKPAPRPGPGVGSEVWKGQLIDFKSLQPVR